MNYKSATKFKVSYSLVIITCLPFLKYVNTINVVECHKLTCKIRHINQQVTVKKSNLNRIQLISDHPPRFKMAIFPSSEYNTANQDHLITSIELF